MARDQTYREGHLMFRCTLLLLITVIVSLSTPLVSAVRAYSPVVPDAEECDAVPQRSLVALFTPAATPPPASQSHSVPEVTSPAGAMTGEALTKLTGAVFACLNEGDYWSLITFVSDDYLIRSFGGGEPEDPLAQLLTPFVNAVRGCKQCTISPRTGDDRLAIATIGDAWVLDDSRTGFEISFANADGSQPVDLFVACVKSEDQWLIDQIYILESGATPAA